jgi:hypothetical protein
MANLTFGQAQGLQPLPAQAQIGTISQETVARLWQVIYSWVHFEEHYGSLRDSHQIALERWWVGVQHQMIDDAPRYCNTWDDVLKSEIQGGFLRAYNLVQGLLDQKGFSDVCAKIIEHVLTDTRAAYRLVEGRIVPFSSQEEHDQLLAAVASAVTVGANGAKSHLLSAGSALTAGDWAQAIQECMAAVEGAARFVSGEHSKELGPILTKLRDDGVIKHGALAEALKKLYGYTSDEQGIRHSLVLQDEANVSEREAFLMLGLCASFVTYMLNLPK